MAHTIASAAVFVSLLLASIGAVAQAPPADQPVETGPTVQCSDYVPTEDRDDAKALALRGVQCFEEQDYKTALKHYRAANAVSESDLLNAAIGRCFQELGHPSLARAYYQKYLASSAARGEGRGRIEQRLALVDAELKEKGAPVTIASDPPGAELLLVVDDSHWESLGATPFEAEMLPGTYEVVVERPGFVQERRKVTVGANKQPVVAEFDMVESNSTFGIPGRQLRRAGIITMASSGPVLLAGVAVFAVGSLKLGDAGELGQFDPARTDMVRRAHSFRAIGATMAILGVAGLTTGLVLWVTGHNADDGDEAEPASEAEGVSIRLVPTSTGVQLLGRF